MEGNGGKIKKGEVRKEANTEAEARRQERLSWISKVTDVEEREERGRGEGETRGGRADGRRQMYRDRNRKRERDKGGGTRLEIREVLEETLMEIEAENVF